MSDFKFACPQCQQHISCGAEYFGRQINCPVCGMPMQVPNPNPPAPAPAPPRSPTPLIPQPPSVPQTGFSCPSCSAPLAAGAVICTACGFNLQTRQKIQPRSAPGQRPLPGAKRPTAPRADAKWYATPYPYLGLYVAVMVALFVLGRSNRGLFLGFLGMALLYGFAVYVTVAVFAFKDGVMKGVLCLICGIYSVYWVYKESENSFLQLAYAVNLLLFLALKFSNLE